MSASAAIPAHSPVGCELCLLAVHRGGRQAAKASGGLARPLDRRHRLERGAASVRFQRAAGKANQVIADTIRLVAAEAGAEPAQVALAWVCAQADRLGVPIVPIPGTKHRRCLEQNVAAFDVHLTTGALARLDPLGGLVAGDHHGAGSVSRLS